MNNRILFIQGGGDEGYEADKKLVASLQTALGETYEVHYPQMLSDETLTDFGWLHQIGKEIANSTGNVILVGHSLGASLLLKYLSENEIKKDYDQYTTAAAKLLSAMQDVSDSNTDAQMRKLKEIMQDGKINYNKSDLQNERCRQCARLYHHPRFPLRSIKPGQHHSIRLSKILFAL